MPGGSYPAERASDFRQTSALTPVQPSPAQTFTCAPPPFSHHRRRTRCRQRCSSAFLPAHLPLCQLLLYHHLIMMTSAALLPSLPSGLPGLYFLVLLGMPPPPHHAWASVIMSPGSQLGQQPRSQQSGKSVAAAVVGVFFFLEGVSSMLERGRQKENELAHRTTQSTSRLPSKPGNTPTLR